jgi:hypothetical protein
VVRSLAGLDENPPQQSTFKSPQEEQRDSHLV